MATSKIMKAVKGAVVGLAMTTATVFQTNGCSMGLDDMTGVTSLLSEALQSSDVAFSFNSSPTGGASPSTGRWSDGGNFQSCNCGYGY